LSVIARLKAGVTLTQAQAEMNTIQARVAAQQPQEVLSTQVAVIPLLEQTLGRNLRLALLILWGVVACVLLIACRERGEPACWRAPPIGRKRLPSGLRWVGAASG
jgi:hypothetical protein